LFENFVPLEAAINRFIEYKTRKEPESAFKRSKTREKLIEAGLESPSPPPSSTPTKDLSNQEQEDQQDIEHTDELINRILAVSEIQEFLSQHRLSILQEDSKPDNKPIEQQQEPNKMDNSLQQIAEQLSLISNQVQLLTKKRIGKPEWGFKFVQKRAQLRGNPSNHQRQVLVNPMAQVSPPRHSFSSRM
jgi:hypothetical protein